MTKVTAASKTAKTARAPKTTFKFGVLSPSAVNEKTAEFVELSKEVTVASESFARIPADTLLEVILEDKYVDGHEGKPDFRLITLRSATKSYTGTARTFFGSYICASSVVPDIDTTGQARESVEVSTMLSWAQKGGVIPRQIECVRELYVSNYHLIPRDPSMKGVMYGAEYYEGYPAYVSELAEIASIKESDEAAWKIKKNALDKTLWNTGRLSSAKSEMALKKGLFRVITE